LGFFLFLPTRRFAVLIAVLIENATAQLSARIVTGMDRPNLAAVPVVGFQN